MTIGTNGDHTNHTINLALDTNDDSYWISKEAENDTFHPTIFVNFTKPTLFEAMVYDVSSKKSGLSRKYFGFPKLMYIYTTLRDDEPLTPKYSFKGDPTDPKMLILLPEPINCTRMKFKFYNVIEIEAGGKFGQADGLHLYRNFEYEQISYQNVDSDYKIQDYVDFHTIPNDIMSVGTNGDHPNHTIKFALDTDGDSYWLSGQPESDTFRPTIYVNFSNPTPFKALIYDVSSKKSGASINYFGFPEKILLYTALGDEEMTPRYLFQGDAMDPHVLFVLPTPVNCTRMKFEFYYVKEIESGGKYGQTDEFHFLRSLINEGEKLEQITPKYSDPAFIESHAVPEDKFVFNLNDDKTDHPLSYAFNDKIEQY